MSIDSDELTRLFLQFMATGGLTLEEEEDVKSVISGRDKFDLPEKLRQDLKEPETETEKEVQTNDLRTLLDNMKVGQKLKIALLGNKQARAILIQDKNRLIQDFVLKNPRLQMSEVEEFAKNPGTPENIMRSIGNNKEWMRFYPMKKAVVFNPKCPLGVGLRWVKFLNNNDLRFISRSKNHQQVLTQAARKLLVDAPGR